MPIETYKGGDALYHSFEVDGKPVGKMRPRATAIGGHARVYTPSAQVSYENWVRECYEQSNGYFFPRGWCLELDMTIYVAMPKSFSKKKQERLMGKPCVRKPDIDNLMKSVMDACNGIMYQDDVQVVKTSARRLWADRDYIRISYIPFEEAL